MIADRALASAAELREQPLGVTLTRAFPKAYDKESPVGNLFVDLMLEARNTVTPTGQECVSRPANGGSLQVLMFASLLGPRLPEVFGFLPREGAREAPELWVQSWDRGYRELSIADLRSQTDLNELAVDAGTQLAGHFWTKFPEPLRAHQRFAQLRAFEMTSTRATLLALVYLGRFESLPHAVRHCCTISRRVDPNPERAAHYQKKFEIYREALAATGPLFARLSQ